MIGGWSAGCSSPMGAEMLSNVSRRKRRIIFQRRPLSVAVEAKEVDQEQPRSDTKLKKQKGKKIFY